MKTYPERLTWALDRIGMSQSELARKTGVKPQSIQYLCNMEKKPPARGSSHTAAFARELGLNPQWLEKGIGPKLAVQAGDNNVSEGPPMRGRVPLISWVRAGDWGEVVDIYEPGDGEGWVDVTCAVHPHTYALRVTGDSMADMFTPGSIIIVEPDREPVPGNFVIAKNGDNEATFKQLVKDGGEWYLKPLNSAYPTKPLGNARIIGVVIQLTKDLCK